MQALSVLTKASVWHEIRVLWAKINHVTSHAMNLAFSLQTKRYESDLINEALYVLIGQEAEKIWEVKVGGW